MPRIARKLYTGQFYHVMVQGIEKKYIFNKKVYKEKYIRLIRYYLEQSNILLIAYCAMDNHVHILIHTNKLDDLSKSMQKINSVYAMYYNKEEKRVGYVYNARFKSERILDRKHLHNCIIYIHQNPVKAKMVKKPEQYLYSSCKEYINKERIFNEKLKELFEKVGFSDNIDFTKKVNSEEYNNFIEVKEDEYILYDILKEHHFKLADIWQSREKMNIVIFAMKDSDNLSLRSIAEKLGLSREMVRKKYINRTI